MIREFESEQFLVKNCLDHSERDNALTKIQAGMKILVSESREY